LSIALTALAAVIAGMVVWPAAQKHYHAARIDSDDPAVRARALEAVLPRAATDASLRDRLLGVLTHLARADDGIGPLQARVAAAWLFQNVPAFTELAERRLDPADDDAFADLARLMILGGRWDVASRSVVQQARWLTHRYRTTAGDDRADVVRSMAALGRAAAPSLGSILEQALSDPAGQVRHAAIASTAIVLGPTSTELLIAAANDREPTNRRAAILMLVATTTEQAGWQTMVRGLSDADAAVREAGAWAASRRTDLERTDPHVHQRLIEMLDQDPSKRVRAMAGLAVRDNQCLIDHLQRSKQVAVRARCCASLRPSLARAHWDVLLGTVESERKYWVAVAAVTAAGRCVRSTTTQDAASRASQPVPNPVRQRLQRALVTRLEQALQHGEDDLAAACVGSLGALASPTVIALLQKVATELADRPWVAFAASQALARVEPTQGGALLIQMLDSRHEAVRALAAFELTRLPKPARPWTRLREARRSRDPIRRGGAVLALALMRHRAREPDAELLEYLRQRTDPNDKSFETRLPLRGYYLCGRLLLGDASALPDLQSLMAADRLSSVAACLTMLAVGNKAGLDGPLLDHTSMPRAFDARALLCDDRFGEVLVHHLPDAPTIDWRFDPELQAWQIDRLREWWRVHQAD